MTRHSNKIEPIFPNCPRRTLLDLCGAMIVGFDCRVFFCGQENEETRSKQHSHLCHTEFKQAEKQDFSAFFKQIGF